MKHLVLLVSAQPMPNFLPFLNKALKPESVTLVVSEKMKDRAEWLKAEIGKHQVEILPDIEIGNAETDISAIQNILMKWADEHQELMSESVLNVTGGTKPMAIAAQEVFRMADRPVFYVDVATDEVSWVSGEYERVRLEKSLTVQQVLGLNGFALKSGDFKSEVENEKWRHFCDEMVSPLNDWAGMLGSLNAKATEAIRNHEKAWNKKARLEALTFNHDPNATPKWRELLKVMRAAELISGATASERFVSVAAARFCIGIWLEHCVFSILKRFGFDKKHALMNAVIVDSKGNRNELDSIVVHRGTCYVIEDKTKNMEGKGSGNVADHAVYKLAQVSKSMGLRTEGILVSAQMVRSADKERARAYGVRVIDGLSGLEGRLKQILRL